MSLQPQARCCVPEDTDRVARAIFPDGNMMMRMYDELGMLFRDADFADIFAKEGQPAESPVRFALVTLRPFWEGVRTYAVGPSCGRMRLCMNPR